MKMQSINPTMYPKFTRKMLVLLCLIFLLGGAVATAQDADSEQTFQTPEDVITAYIQAVADNDISRTMQTLAVDEMSENFRFDLYIERLRALTPQAPAPSDYEFYAEINKAQFTSQLLFQVKNLAYGLLATEKGVTDGQVMLLEPEEFAQFALEVDPARLAGLEVVSIDIPYPDLLGSDINLKNSSAMAAIYGADEHTDRVALLMFENEYYFIGFTLLRYGDNWKINSLSSPISGASAMGAPNPISEEDYQDMITGD